MPFLDTIVCLACSGGHHQRTCRVKPKKEIQARDSVFAVLLTLTNAAQLLEAYERCPDTVESAAVAYLNDAQTKLPLLNLQEATLRISLSPPSKVRSINFLYDITASQTRPVLSNSAHTAPRMPQRVLVFPKPSSRLRSFEILRLPQTQMRSSRSFVRRKVLASDF